VILAVEDLQVEYLACGYPPELFKTLTIKEYRSFMKAATLRLHREAVSSAHASYLLASLIRAKKLPKISKILPKPPKQPPKKKDPKALSSGLRSMAIGLGISPEEYDKKARKI